jgi:phosphonate transport system substrate-binding protein
LFPAWLWLVTGNLVPSETTATAESPIEEPRRLIFGVYAHIRSTELFKKVAPFQSYLQQNLAARGVNAKVDLKIYARYSRGIEALVNGEVDFVRFGPVSYVLAKKQNPHIRLLAMEGNQGSKQFKGIISVPADSPIHSLAELRGKRVAFGNRRSTTGRYLAQAALIRSGIRARDLGGYAYLGRHDKVAFAVAAGNYDAGATNENTFHKYAKAKGLRKIGEFPCVTKPWVAKAGLDDRLFGALRATLLELQDPALLKLIKRTGLLPAEDSDYDRIREAMTLAQEFDPRSLTFGVYTSEKPTEVYNMVQPTVALLQQKLTAEGRIETVRTKVFRSYQAGVDALVRGDIEFGRFGPASYVIAKDRNPGIRVVAREDNGGPPAVGLIVVGSDSKVTSLADLKGKTFAFGDRYSTEGNYGAKAALLKAGVSGHDLQRFSYLGRHDRVAYAVALGN